MSFQIKPALKKFVVQKEENKDEKSNNLFDEDNAISFLNSINGSGTVKNKKSEFIHGAAMRTSTSLTNSKQSSAGGLSIKGTHNEDF